MISAHRVLGTNPLSDVSPDYKYDFLDATIGNAIINREATPDAIKYFAEHCADLSNYGYWFLLGTCWVSYSGWSDLDLWKRLFSSGRPRRRTSLMKPSELVLFERLSHEFTAFRAHRPAERDWIAYTIDPIVAVRFAMERKIDSVESYQIKKRDALALFTRRGEAEVLLLDRTLARSAGEIPIIKAATA